MSNQEDEIDIALIQGRRFIEKLDHNARVALAFSDNADGVSASVVAAKSLSRLGYLELLHLPADIGESLQNFSMQERIGSYKPDALLVFGMGSCSGDLLDVPTLILDDHVPKGRPPGATFLNASTWGEDASTSSLVLALFAGLTNIRSLVWKAAIGLVGERGRPAVRQVFPQLSDLPAIEEWAELINAAKRSSWHDIETPHRLLMSAEAPGEIRDGLNPSVAKLRAYREEVQEETARCMEVEPRFTADTALLLFSSRCGIQGPVANRWASRLSNKIILAANAGLAEDRIHFSLRTEGEADLIAFLETHSAGIQTRENFAQGHRHATGGVLALEDFLTLLRHLGFSPAVEDEARRQEAP